MCTSNIVSCCAYYTGERSFQAKIKSDTIRMNIHTSAQNVANVVKVAISWQDTGDVTPERNRLNVLYAANDSQSRIIL